MRPHVERDPGVEHRHEVLERPLRSLTFGCAACPPAVVLVPGLGAVGALRPVARVISETLPCAVLDVPGGEDRPGPACAPEVPAVARTVAAWLAGHAPVPVVLVGHSTGAQAALHVAAALPETVIALVLVGPTLAPPARRPAGLLSAGLLTTPTEPPRVLPAVLPDYLRVGVRRLLRYIRSGMDDRPEEVVERVRCPVTLIRGARDRYATAGWIEELARRAGGPGRALTVPGAHAFAFTRPEPVAAAVLGATAGQR